MRRVQLARTLPIIIGVPPLLPSLPFPPPHQIKKNIYSFSKAWRKTLLFSVEHEYGHQHHEKQQEIQLNRNCVAPIIVFVAVVVYAVFVIKFFPQCHSWVNFNAFAWTGGYSETNPIPVVNLFERWIFTFCEFDKFSINFALVKKMKGKKKKKLRS